MLYTRANTYLPWLLRVIVFDLQGGFDAALLFNLLAGTASIILLWYAALAGGHSTRVCVLFGLLLAITPMYVRHSGSDSVYVAILFLYSACAAASLPTMPRRAVAAPPLVLDVLGMLIRGETAVVFQRALLSVARRHQDQAIVRPRAPLILLAVAGLAGSLTIVSLQSHRCDGSTIRPPVLA